MAAERPMPAATHAVNRSTRGSQSPTTGAGVCGQALPFASCHPTDDWPRFEVTGYLRAIDFNARFSHEQIIRQYVPYPKLGRGQGVPRQGLVKIVSQPVTKQGPRSNDQE